MNKKEVLEKLRKEMEADKSLPLRKGATRLVFGVGNPETKIIFIGEGPGYFEDQKGEPFVGNAGQLLNSLLYSIKLPRKDVFITNVVHHRPPNNRDPLPEELSAYGKYLDKELEIIKPKIIVTLGRFSMGKFLPGRKITSIHGKEYQINWKGMSVLIIPMFHPAAALRSTEVMRMIKDDFLNLSELLANLKKEESQTKLEQMKFV